jgi:hypothetical protein
MTGRDWDVTAAEEEQRSRDWESLGRRGLDDPRRCRQEARYHRRLARSARRNAEQDRDDGRDWPW